MPITKSQVWKKIDLDIPKDLSASEKRELKELIGQFVVDSILDRTGSAKTSVSGGEYKASLSKKYKRLKDELGGQLFANLELEGDMLSSLTYEDGGGNSIKVGIFDGDQAAKAYGHNTGFKGHPTIKGGPKRQFIPAPDEEFARPIMSGIKDIIADFTDGD